MMAVNAAPPPAGAGPTGPEGGGAGGRGDERREETGAADRGSVLDPIFQGVETVEQPTKKATLLFQFFLFPLLIVIAAVGVFLFFGLLGGSSRSAREYLDEVMQGGENAQKQAAHQLAVLLAEARKDHEAKVAAGKESVPFYVDPRFRDDLARAFTDSFPDRSLERKQFLALSMGSVGDPAFVKPLVAHLKTPTGEDESSELRQAIAEALATLEQPEALPALVELSKDQDVLVANRAVFGLSMLRSEPSTDALRAALGDARFEVQANAAGALALRGVDSGLPILEKTLDPKALEGLGIKTEDGRRSALWNAIRGVHALRVDRLKPQVKALEDHGDPIVRKLARESIDHWDDPR
jgi:hypothetical protein